MSAEFPLGSPINRPAAPLLDPIPGRPNWWQPRGSTGAPVYVEPPKPKGPSA